MWLGFVAWLPLADFTAGETAAGELPLAVCLMGDCALRTTLQGYCRYHTTFTYCKVLTFGDNMEITKIIGGRLK